MILCVCVLAKTSARSADCTCLGLEVLNNFLGANRDVQAACVPSPNARHADH